MKPTDLMLNDWVLWNSRYVQIVRTCAYTYYYGHREVWLAHCNDDNFIECHDMSTISPIPLTPKILKKNGWKETAYWHEYQYNKITIQCCLPELRGKINGIEVEHFKCEYVHQYQHLLRLCGLDELADNFKI